MPSGWPVRVYRVLRAQRHQELTAPSTASRPFLGQPPPEKAEYYLIKQVKVEWALIRLPLNPDGCILSPREGQRRAA